MIALNADTKIFETALVEAQLKSIADFVGTWWIAQTRPRYEKQLAAELGAAGVDYFLPIERLSKESPNGTKRIFNLPVFPLYLFLCGDADARYRAATSKSTCQMIRVVNQAKLQRELLSIEQCVSAGGVYQRSRTIWPGQRCRVISGPLMGREGKFIRRNGSHALALEVSMLGQAIEMAIDENAVEVL